MSRTYKMEIDVTPVVGDEALGLTKNLLGDCGMDVDDYMALDDGKVCFWGHMDIGGGRTPEDAHNELLEELQKARVPEVRIVTRWLCMDALEWDEVIGDEPCLKCGAPMVYEDETACGQRCQGCQAAEEDK